MREQILSQGFVQGLPRVQQHPRNLNDEYLRKPAANCPCVFYKPGLCEDTVIMVYVDDIIGDGRQKYLDAFFTGFQDVSKLTVDNPLDFNGIIISMDDVCTKFCICMDMQPYIVRSSTPCWVWFIVIKLISISLLKLAGTFSDPFGKSIVINWLAIIHYTGWYTGKNASMRCSYSYLSLRTDKLTVIYSSK